MQILKKQYLANIDKYLKELKDYWDVENKIEALKVVVKVSNFILSLAVIRLVNY